MIAVMDGVDDVDGRGNARTHRKRKGARIETRAPVATGAHGGVARQRQRLNGGLRHIGEIAKMIVEGAEALCQMKTGGRNRAARLKSKGED